MFFTPQTKITKHWERAFILVDMDAFFAQIEQLDFPELRGQPIAITNGYQGTGIITCSYEARSYGIKTCMRLKHAKKLCPKLIRRPARPKRYSEISKKIMKVLRNITPDLEIFSVDEAFLDITKCQKLYGTPKEIGLITKKYVFESSGLLCSIGISSDKTIAKLAAKQNKPNGITIIPPWKAKNFLKNKPVSDLCGINQGITKFLLKYGVCTCQDITKIPMSILTKRFGNIGRRIWLMCQAQDPEDIQSCIPTAKSMGHSKIMPPKTTDQEIIQTYLLHMCEKLANRLRKNSFKAKTYLMCFRNHKTRGIKTTVRSPIPINDGSYLHKLCYKKFILLWQGESFCQLSITAIDVQPAYMQGDLFTKPNIKRTKINTLVDKINSRYGEFTICPLRLINRSSMPNVISPSWKPNGHRQSII